MQMLIYLIFMTTVFIIMVLYIYDKKYGKVRWQIKVLYMSNKMVHEKYEEEKNFKYQMIFANLTFWYEKNVSR